MFDESWYSHQAKRYEPKWERDVDRSPDRNPAAAPIVTEDVVSHGVVQAIPVRGLGVVVLRAVESDPDTGRMKFGVSIFTDEEIRFHDLQRDRYLTCPALRVPPRERP